MADKIKKQKHVVRICLIEGCNNKATTDKFCRLHYLKHWKKNHSGEKLTKKKKHKYDEKMDLCDLELSDFFTGDNFDEDVEEIIHNLRIDD